MRNISTGSSLRAGSCAAGTHPLPASLSSGCGTQRPRRGLSSPGGASSGAGEDFLGGLTAVAAFRFRALFAPVVVSPVARGPRAVPRTAPPEREKGFLARLPGLGESPWAPGSIGLSSARRPGGRDAPALAPRVLAGPAAGPPRALRAPARAPRSTAISLAATAGTPGSAALLAVGSLGAPPAPLLVLPSSPEAPRAKLPEDGLARREDAPCGLRPVPRTSARAKGRDRRSRGSRYRSRAENRCRREVAAR